MPETQANPPRFQCRHIFTDGHRCGSPTLREQPFCYYHHTSRPPVHHPRPVDSSFDLPVPEDRSAIQAGIGEILRRLAANVLDTKRAGLMLYALQIASLNLPRTKPAVEPSTPGGPVEDVTLDNDLGTLAPPTQLGEPVKQEGYLDRIMREFKEYERDENGSITDPSYPFPPESREIPTPVKNTAPQDDSKFTPVPVEIARDRNNPEPENPATRSRDVICASEERSRRLRPKHTRVQAHRENRKAHPEGWACVYAGDHLISHTLTRAVPSAQRGLTSVFGMGTGGTLAVNSPANCRTCSLSRSFTTE